MPETQDTNQIQGLPPGATLKPIQPQAADTSHIEGLPAGAVLKPIQPTGEQPPQTATKDASDSQAGDPLLSRIGRGIGQSVESSIVAPIRGAVSEPQDVNEVIAHASGGQPTLIAYRLGKQVVDSMKKMASAPKEHYQQAKQDFIRAAKDFHDKNYRAAVTDVASAAMSTQGMMPGVDSEMADRQRELVEGTRPGGNLATPLARDVTDVATMYVGEKLPEVTAKVGKGLQEIAPKPMNALLKANKEANYLYGKNPGQAFIDEKIKLPKNSVTFHGQLENLSGQLEQAGDRLNTQIKTELSQSEVATKQIDVVPTIQGAIGDAKKFIAKQTGLDVPKYVEELNKLQDNLLTRYDDEGNSLGKLTQTKMSPAEVADMKRSIGKNTDWRVNYTDPDFKLKTYLNGVRKRIYGQLADEVENAAPNSNIKELNQRFSNVIEAQGLLDKRLFSEAGTGGLGAALRHGELLGALVTALSHGMTGEAGLAGAAGLALDAVRRTPIARVAQARVAGAAGKSLQSGMGQGAAQITGAAAKIAPAIGAASEDTSNWRHISTSDGKHWKIHPEDLGEAQRRDPSLIIHDQPDQP